MQHLMTFESYDGKSEQHHNVNMIHQDLISQIQKCLTPDLLKGMWKKNPDPANPMGGHCYAASEALYWMLGGPDSGFTPYVISQRNYPDLFEPGESHWYLMNKAGDVLDVTVAQFGDHQIKYELGIANGMMNHPLGGSKRARTIIERIEKL